MATLVAHYTLNDSAANTVVAEETGTVPFGVLTGGENTNSVSVSGKRGNAFYFDGNDYVQCGSDADLYPTTVSVATWVKFDDLTTFQSLISRTESGGYAFTISNTTLATGETLAFICHDNITAGIGGYNWATYPRSSLSTGVWYHIAGTYDGSNIKLYLNGSLVDTTAHPGSLNKGADKLLIAAEPQQNGSPNVDPRYLTGTLDDVRIYSGALTATEVSNLYNGDSESDVPRIVSQITIDANNKVLRATDSGGSPFSATLTEGDYFISGSNIPAGQDKADLLYEIKTQLIISGSDEWTVTNSSGTISIGCDANFELNWTDGSTTFDGSWLGYDTSADDTGSAGGTIDSDNQHKYGWYPDNAISQDSVPYQGTAGAPRVYIDQQQAPTGSVHTVYRNTQREARTLTIQAEAAHKALADSSNANESWIEFANLAADGRRCLYYEGSTLTFDCLLAPAAINVEPHRMDSNVNLYSWRIPLLKYVS